jgi:hypothetical protein
MLGADVSREYKQLEMVSCQTNNTLIECKSLSGLASQQEAEKKKMFSRILVY